MSSLEILQIGKNLTYYSMRTKDKMMSFLGFLFCSRLVIMLTVKCNYFRLAASDDKSLIGDGVEAKTDSAQ